MAPKTQTAASTSLVIPETTNYLTIPSETEANPRYKCFVRFLNTSYLNGALFLNPTLYVDVLEAFWRSATCSTFALDDGSTKIEINCSIGEKAFSFGADEINRALNLPTAEFNAEATYEEMVEFLDFIHYEDTINLGKLNKKNVRREWSFLFDAL